ncbi:MAG: hypothetical protein ACYDGR_03155 [Candidatus Dormibacteria bacterium]
MTILPVEKLGLATTLHWRQQTRIAAAALALLALAGCAGGSDGNEPLYAKIPIVADSPTASPAPTLAPTMEPSSAPSVAAGGQYTLPPPPPVRQPVPVICPPLPNSGPNGGNLAFTGACQFNETRIVPCPNSPQAVDDFYLRWRRPMKNNLTIYIDINVEKYHGPDTYAGTASIIIEIPDNDTIYEWSTSAGTVTINQDQKSGSLPQVDLPPSVGTPTQGTEYMQGTFVCS